MMISFLVLNLTCLYCFQIFMSLSICILYFVILLSAQPSTVKKVVDKVEEHEIFTEKTPTKEQKPTSKKTKYVEKTKTEAPSGKFT